MVFYLVHNSRLYVPQRSNTVTQPPGLYASQNHRSRKGRYRNSTAALCLLIALIYHHEKSQSISRLGKSILPMIIHGKSVVQREKGGLEQKLLLMNDNFHVEGINTKF